MNWVNIQDIEWVDPVAFASCYSGHDIALLYSGLAEEKTGGKSYLFTHPIARVEAASCDALPETEFVCDDACPLPDWVGYLGYELGTFTKRDVANAHVPFPTSRLVRYGQMFRFDHATKRVTQFGRESSISSTSEVTSRPLSPPSPFARALGYRPTLPSMGGGNVNAPRIRSISSNMTRGQYEQCIADTVDRIEAGDFYQANITRKFYGEFSAPPDSLAMFVRLTELSPAPYSAYIRHGTSAILSASPECFLRSDADGTLTTRPIKGSARRGATETEDAAIKRALQTSIKNHAENLMIVDLMRNDLAQVSVPESVAVTEQSGLYSYATIHHLISTIEGKKRPEISVAEVINACFPPGSMTGAPKRAAMEWCTAQEQRMRGIYSGAIGWLGPQNTCDLSVVIRTLLIDETRFEFQVGGGIVADSVPEEEFQETLTKARAILALLGVSEAEMIAL